MYHSKRLYFRKLVSEDMERLFEIYSDAEAMRYRQSPIHYTIMDTYDMLKRDEEMKNSNKEIRFGIVESESNILIGSIMYQPINDKCIIGYSFDNFFWGKGYATEAVNWIINFLKSKKFRLIEAWVIKENIASCKVLCKNGFQMINQTIYPNSKYYQKYI